MPEQIAWVVIGAFVSGIFFLLINRKDKHSSPCPAIKVLDVRVSEIGNKTIRNAAKIENNKESIQEISVEQGEMRSDIKNIDKTMERIESKLDKLIDSNHN
jgi:hypothetical protein